MKTEKIVWKKINNEYFSDDRYEFSISYNDGYWILSYTDFWTIKLTSFFVNIKNNMDDAVFELKKYADFIVENRILNTDIIEL